MTFRSRVFALFPGFWLFGSAAAALGIATAPTAGKVLTLLAVLYLLPVALFRIHQLAWPLPEGLSRIDAPGYSPWWGGHQFQVGYSAFPALEAALRLVPGAYSAWLRLWGSRVGSAVYWTPLVEITDRSLLDIGDGVVFGHRSACYGHLIKRRNEHLALYVRRIRIGHGALLGAGSRLGPGSRVDDGAVVPLLTDVGVGQRIRPQR